MSGIPCERCPSCDKMKYSASKNPDGLCDECRGNPASKPPAPTVGETPRTDFNEYEVTSRLNRWDGDDEIITRKVVDSDFARQLERDLTAAQLQIDRLKAGKIDMFALAKELGPKISLNFNEWALIARAVEAQLNKEPRK